MNGYLIGNRLGRHRTGLVIGALIGLVTGSFPGLLLGAYVGYNLDKMVQGYLNKEYWSQDKIQTAFFEATFAVMGKLAKADGRVTRAEIDYAETVMTRMQLRDERRQLAIDSFSRGKQIDFEIAEKLAPLSRALGSRNRHARLLFIEIQLGAALVDGQFSVAEGRILGDMCQLLGIGQAEFEAVANRVAAQQSFHQQASGQRAPQPNELADAYGTLGVAKDCDDKTLKRAYRKLMSQHHPDKLEAEGVPAEMMQLAKQKTQEIQAAYELVKQSRKQ